jgi:hypothetical protein
MPSPPHQKPPIKMRPRFTLLTSLIMATAVTSVTIALFKDNAPKADAPKNRD